MDPKVKAWIAERRVVKSSLTRFKTFVRESMRSTPVDNVQKRLAVHVPLFERFSKLQDQIDIVVMDTDMEPSQSDERDQFSDLYFSLITEVESYIKTVTLDNNKDSTANPPSGSAINSIASHSQHHNLRSTKQDETRVVQPLVNPHRNATSSTYDTSQTSQSFQYQDINP